MRHSPLATVTDLLMQKALFKKKHNAARSAVAAPRLSAAQKTAEISLPVAITVFPDEVYRAPETWARRAYRNLIYFHEVDKGGHFAAWERPELFAAELRAALSLRPAY
jgi:pimeloyl-ACP methyl ester carboxylesterase